MRPCALPASAASPAVTREPGEPGDDTEVRYLPIPMPMPKVRPSRSSTKTRASTGVVSFGWPAKSRETCAVPGEAASPV
ncbi:hypothetical protein J2790_000239 [Paenarthrobacter nicotinovorans]|nr:hypothetical protein [Paenarthrobacter nicotinovorans]SCZ58791.1 hypothetical protein SAMN02799638_02533 [Arthrobacter sp. UNCCL28]